MFAYANVEVIGAGTEKAWLWNHREEQSTKFRAVDGKRRPFRGQRTRITALNIVFHKRRVGILCRLAFFRFMMAESESESCIVLLHQHSPPSQD